MNIAGNPIYKSGELTVHQHNDGFTISNGTDFVIVKEMPCLNDSILRSFFSTHIDNYSLWQINKYGSIIKTATGIKVPQEDPFDKWYQRETELAHLDAQGY